MMSGAGVVIVIGAGMGFVDSGRSVEIGWRLVVGGLDVFGRFWSCGGIDLAVVAVVVGAFVVFDRFLLCGGVTWDISAGSWRIGWVGGIKCWQEGQRGWRSGATGRGLIEASASQSGRRDRKSALEFRRAGRYLI